MTLDERARSAADGLQSAVLTAHPVAPPFPPAPVGPAWLRPALTFALSAVIVAVGAFLISRPEPQVADIPDPTNPVITETTIGETTSTSAATTTTESIEVDESTPTSQADVGIAPPAPEADVTPPVIQILSPTDGARFTDSRLTFTGITEPGAQVMFGPYEADVDTEGNWSIVLILSEGGNRTTAVATDPAGNVAEASVVVYLDPPVTTTLPKDEPPKEDPPKEDPPAEVEFHADQLYGTCAEDPPYDVFFGTGVAGHTVKVSSDFGSGTTTIKEDGTFEITVFFESAPLDVTFDVLVKDKDTGESFSFSFVHTG